MSELYSANTVLLLHMEGSNGSTTFTDSSGIPKTITRYGNAQISTAQSKWGNGSGYFDGTGDYLSLTGASFSTGDFTIEAWIFVTTPSSSLIIFDCRDTDLTDSGFAFYVRGATEKLAFGRGASFVATESTTSVSATTWIHAALSRSAGTVKGFLNGIQEFSVTDTKNFSFTGWVVGHLWNASGTLSAGYFQDVRVTNGVARYTADFTPPIALLPDPDPPTGLILPSGYRQDIYDGGAFRITGNVDELGVMGAYRVRLFDRQSARCIRETWSAADGSYEFPYIAYRYQGYFAIAYDHGDSPLNAAIADLITPEPMP